MAARKTPKNQPEKRKPQPGDDDYIGKGVTPKHTRFQPGQSGNPRGRPKGTKNLKTDLAEELAEKMTVTINGKQVKLSKQRLMLKALAAKAVKGDVRAADTVIRLVAQTVGLDPQTEADRELSLDDQAILDDWLQHNARELDSGEPHSDNRSEYHAKGK